MKITLNYKDDNVNGVAVNVADESFVISLHDAENGEEKDFDEWQQYYKQNNCRTFNRKQACIIAAYLDEGLTNGIGQVPNILSAPPG